MKRSLLWITILIISMSLLATFSLFGCKEEEVAEEEEAVAEEAPAEETTASEVITLRFQDWRLSEETPSKIADGLIADFEKENPNIKIELDPVTYDDHVEKFSTQAMGGAPPDIVAVVISDIPQLASQLLDLTKYVKDSGIMSLIYPNLDGFCLHEGKYYGIPLNVASAEALYINVELFEKAGLDPNKPPIYWEDVLEYGKKMTGNGVYGYVTPGKADMNALTYIYPVLLQSGKPLKTEEDWKNNLNTSEVLKQFSFYMNLYLKEKIVPNPLDIDFREAQTLFAQEKLGIYPGGPWNIGGILEKNPAMKDKMRVVNYPYPKGGKPVVTIDGSNYVIAKDTKHPEEAWKFALYMSSEKAQALNLTAGFLPSIQSIDLSEEYLKNNPLMKAYVDQISIGQTRLVSVHYNEVAKIMWEEEQKAWAGSQTPEQALKNASERINQVFAK